MNDTSGMSGWGNGLGLILILLFLGLGGNGFGAYGRQEGVGVPSVPLTAEGYQSGQNFQNITNGLNSLETNLVQGFNASQLSSADLKMQLCTCCNDIQTQVASGFGATQLAGCQNTNQLIINQNTNTQKILDAISTNELASANRENTRLQSELTTANLKAYISSNCAGCGSSTL